MLTQNKFLTENEVSDLLKELNNKKGERDSIMIRLAIYTGARGAEVLTVRKEDISEGCVTIWGKKGSNNRTVPLPNDFYAELVEFANKTEGLLFDINTRRLRAIWAKYRVSDKGFHSLRHTAGIKVYAASRNIHLVQTILGHKSITNTERYLKFVESKEALQKTLATVWG